MMLCYVCMWYLLRHVMNEMKCYVLPCKNYVMDYVIDYHVYMIYIYIYVISHGWKEKENDVTLCYEYKSRGPHVCMLCASKYFLVMLVRTCTFDIYVRHNIMRVVPFLWRSAIFNVLCPTKQGQGYVYEPAWWVHVRVRGLCIGKSKSCYLCDCIINLNRVTYRIFLKIFKSRAILILFR